ncbi:hypothetical protein [Nonomuraea helvata]|uniref:Uncharacterized protein n=1 Tax=Nonomuraea helvata TaxID=37484 RepID=A0ABV5SAS7_9ACTN
MLARAQWHDHQRGVGEPPGGQARGRLQTALEVQGGQQFDGRLDHERGPGPLGVQLLDGPLVVVGIDEPPRDTIAVGVYGMRLEHRPADRTASRLAIPAPAVGPLVGPLVSAEPDADLAVGLRQPGRGDPRQRYAGGRADEQQASRLVRLLDDAGGIDRQHRVRRVFPHHPDRASLQAPLFSSVTLRGAVRHFSHVMWFFAGTFTPGWLPLPRVDRRSKIRSRGDIDSWISYSLAATS